ncbi:MAG: haloacid dehalogenase type II [Acetobacteraceae bacterium]
MTIKAIVFDAYGTLYDVQSVVRVTDAAFPGHGDFITQVWRMKQLEYTWLRSMMGRYEDFWTITKDALAYTIGLLGLEADAGLFDRIAETYNTLDPYPDAKPALQSLSGYRLAILSNGSPDMLRALVHNTGLDHLLEATISVDAKKAFKPDPRAYALVEERLGLRPEQVLFVSSNGFDISGAKSFGFKVARIERVTRAALRDTLTDAATIGPLSMFKALRTQVEAIGPQPDFVLGALSDLPKLAAGGFTVAS